MIIHEIRHIPGGLEISLSRLRWWTRVPEPMSVRGSVELGWFTIHGAVSRRLERQISGKVLARRFWRQELEARRAQQIEVCPQHVHPGNRNTQALT